ncbi:Filament plant protein [Salix suchowensis]|nr:Filament plant protein [Salix suchowensis]
MATQIIFYIEVNEVLTRELAEDGYSGVEVRVTPMPTEIIIRATRTQNVLGEKGGRIRELTSIVQKRFKFPENAFELYSEKVSNMASVPLRRLSLFVTSSLEALLFAGCAWYQGEDHA